MSPGLDSVDLSCDGEVLGKSWAQYWVSAAEASPPLSVVFTNRRGGCFYCRSHCTEEIQHFDYDVCQVGDGISVEIGIYSNIYLMKQ